MGVQLLRTRRESGAVWDVVDVGQGGRRSRRPTPHRPRRRTRPPSIRFPFHRNEPRPDRWATRAATRPSQPFARRCRQPSSRWMPVFSMAGGAAQRDHLQPVLIQRDHSSPVASLRCRRGEGRPPGNTATPPRGASDRAARCRSPRCPPVRSPDPPGHPRAPGPATRAQSPPRHRCSQVLIIHWPRRHHSGRNRTPTASGRSKVTGRSPRRRLSVNGSLHPGAVPGCG